MITLDFLLYDNRTWSPRWGRDWGLKAASGVLADRADLIADFDRYCGAMPGEQGQLSRFGEAIGGLRSRKGDGYLLCISLESADSFGRPSWAAFGLWCPDRTTLGQVLTAGDPVSSVRAMLGAETPPRTIEIRPAKETMYPKRRRHVSALPTYRRFDPGTSVREVISLLLGEVQGKTALPNVLAITATSHLAAVGRAGFDLVYCHPLEDRAERALVRVMSSQKPFVAELWTPPLDRTPPSIQASRTEVEAPKQFTRSELRTNFPWLPVLSIGLVCVAVIIFLVGEIRRNHLRVPSARPTAEVSVSGASSAPMDSVPEQLSTERKLDEMKERLEECKRLVPADLRQSPGFEAAENLKVIPAYQANRERVQQAYSALIEIRDRMVKRQGNYVAYYYDEAGRDAGPATRLQKIGDILSEAPLGNEDCKVLKEAFGFEFENRGSALRRWCDSVGRLEATAVRSLSIPMASPRSVSPRPAPTPG